MSSLQRLVSAGLLSVGLLFGFNAHAKSVDANNEINANDKIQLAGYVYWGPQYDSYYYYRRHYPWYRDRYHYYGPPYVNYYTPYYRGHHHYRHHHYRHGHHGNRVHHRGHHRR